MKKLIARDLPVGRQKMRDLSFQLLEAVNLTFNQSWFFNLCEETPLGHNELHLLLDGLEKDAFFNPDPKRLAETCNSLDELVSYTRRFLLPGLREKLGVSCLTPVLPDKKSDLYIRAGFIACVFPANLQRVETLLRELRRELPAGVPLPQSVVG